jgi:toxin CcdB
MARFDVYRNPHRNERVPYLLDVQHDLLSHLKTRIVIPLISAERVTAMTRLNPVFEIENRKVVMSTTELAGIPIKDIGEPVGSLDGQRSDIIATLDYVFTGV